MKMINNHVNGTSFTSVLGDIDWANVDKVKAAIAYVDDKRSIEFFEECVKNGKCLDFYCRHDHRVPVKPNALEWFLNKASDEYKCRLIDEILHSKVVWWQGYGAYIGSANFSHRAWETNIESGIFFTEDDLGNHGLGLELEKLFQFLDAPENSSKLTNELYEQVLEYEKQRKPMESEDEKQKQSFQRTRPPKAPIGVASPNLSDRKPQQGNFITEEHIRDVLEEFAQKDGDLIERNEMRIDRDFEIEILSKFNDGVQLPDDKMAVFGFYYNSQWLNFYYAGSGTEQQTKTVFRNNHYNPDSMRSSLAGYVLMDKAISQDTEINRGNIKEWMKENFGRLHIFMPKRQESYLCNHLKHFLLRKFETRYRPRSFAGR